MLTAKRQGGRQMYEQKTKENDNDVIAFIENVGNPKRRESAFRLLDLFTEASGYPARMWGTSIVGFGSYHYKYASGHEGIAPLVGFSPRKANISLYFAAADPEREPLLSRLGKYRAGKSCVYINKIDDIDIDVLKELIRASVIFLKKTYPESK